MVCTKKKIVHGKCVILGTKMAHPYNSGLTLRIFLKLCRMNGANRHTKVLLVVFGEKNSLEVI